MIEFFCSIGEFISRNEGDLVGSFLGALFAGLIAIYSVIKTHNLTKEREQKKIQIENNEKINRYCSIVHSVIVELNWHKEINPMIISQIEGIREKSKRAGKMIIDEPTTFIEIDYLRKLRDKLFSFALANHVIPTHLQLYTNRSLIINRSLKLSIIDETMKRFDEPENFGKGVDLYFDQLLRDFAQLDVALKQVLNFSLTEINRFPNAEVHIYYNHNIDKSKR